MQIELRSLDQIRPYDNNPRDNDDAVDAVIASIKEFGWRQPIVVDAEGVIIVGHTRYKAAQKMGLKQVPVHVATDLTPAQVKAYRIADNATNEIATWNYDLLPIELGALKEMEFDIGMLGFDPEELQRIMSGDVQQGMTDPDEVPAPPDEAITQPGDLWILGNHRLLCGDSSKPDDVDRLLDGARIQLVNTDPPYNVKVEPRSNNAIAAGLSSFSSDALQQKKLLNKTCRMETADGITHHQSLDLARHPEKAKGTTKKLRAKDRPLANDFVSDEAFDQLLDAWFGNIARVLEPGRVMYCWGGYANCANYPPFLKKHGLYFSQAIIWVKEHPVLTRKDFMGNHEWCFYSWREGAGHKFFGPNNATDVWSVKKVNPQSMVHLTEKPVELAVRAMQYSSLTGENVLDLFGGSGSTLVAAEQTGRRAFLMELDPLYCDVICERFAKFAGVDPVEALTGQMLTRKFRRDDGAEMTIERCLIDANWGNSTDVVYQFCRQSTFAGIVMPSHGKYVGASSVPFSDYKPKKGDRTGLHWRVPALSGKRAVRYTLIDTNYWKSFVQARLAVPMGDPGCLSLFAGADHRLVSEHLTAEYRVKTEGRGRQLEEWKIRAPGLDNHWLDCLVGCAVGASMQGAVLFGTDTRQLPRRPRVRLSELQGRRR